MKQNFEEIIKNSVNNHEMPYESGAWESFVKNTAKASPFYKSGWFIGIALLSLTLLLVTTTMFTPNPTKNEVAKNILKNRKQFSENSAGIKEEVTIAEDYQQVSSEPTENTVVTFRQTKNKQTLPLQTTSTDLTGQKEKANTAAELSKRTQPRNFEESAAVTASAEFYLPKSICEGETIYLTAQENHINRRYQWFINRTITLEGSNQNYKAAQSGETEISLAVFDNKGNELAKKTHVIEVNPKMELSVSLENNPNSLINQYTFEVSGAEQHQVTWDFGDGTQSNKNSANHSYKKMGVYEVKCSSSTEYGCKSSTITKLEIPGIYNFRKDYGFSPNGDNINDNFIPVELTSLAVDFVMNIYARNGQLIFTTNSAETPWNGMLANGTRCLFGSYVWVVTLTNEYGNEEVYKGTITNVSN